MKKIVLLQDEIDKLKGLKEEFQQLTNVVGQIEIQIMNLQLRKEELKLNLQQIQQQEVVLAKELEDKYGNGTISLESGEFLPNG